MITSKTRLLGLFGNPVEHSISPVFMNYILDMVSLDYRYFAFQIKEELLTEAVKSIIALNIKGVNITIPYKRSVIKHLDEVESSAGVIEAVNCIKNEGERLKGYNTDYLGFIYPLKDKGYNQFLKGKNCLLIGCGGAARAVIYGLKIIGIEKVFLINRTPYNAERFSDWVKDKIGINIEYVGDKESLTDRLMDEVDMVVNTTPVGMYPHIDEMPVKEGVKFKDKHIVYDLIYNPWETKLLKISKSNGAVALNGFDMLISQGLYSLAIWFNDTGIDFLSFYRDVSGYAKNFLQD